MHALLVPVHVRLCVCVCMCVCVYVCVQVAPPPKWFSSHHHRSWQIQTSDQSCRRAHTPAPQLCQSLRAQTRCRTPCRCTGRLQRIHPHACTKSKDCVDKRWDM